MKNKNYKRKKTKTTLTELDRLAADVCKDLRISVKPAVVKAAFIANTRAKNPSMSDKVVEEKVTIELAIVLMNKERYKVMNLLMK